MFLLCADVFHVIHKIYSRFIGIINCIPFYSENSVNTSYIYIVVKYNILNFYKILQRLFHLSLNFSPWCPFFCTILFISWSYSLVCVLPVSYTHLDVYKRQVQCSLQSIIMNCVDFLRLMKILAYIIQLSPLLHIAITSDRF